MVKLMSRNDYYKKIGMAKNALIQQGKLTEGDYRGMLAMHGAIEDRGRFSASTLSSSALESVLSKLKALGWNDKAIRQKGPLKVINKPLQRKIWALWFELKNLGAIESDSKQALDTWIRNQSGVPVTVSGINALSAKQHRDTAIKLVEQLKKWLEREQAARESERKAG